MKLMDNNIIGLKRGIVQLERHNTQWEVIAQETIKTLYPLFKDTVIDIQHIGSTSIKHIHAKPIIDLVVGVTDLDKVKELIPLLEIESIQYREQDIPNQLLFVMGDITQEIRTHHIHIVKHKSIEWNNYINFRDYLNEFPDKAHMYETLKLNLANTFPMDRIAYTNGKHTLISNILNKAERWKNNSHK